MITTKQLKYPASLTAITPPSVPLVLPLGSHYDPDTNTVSSVKEVKSWQVTEQALSLLEQINQPIAVISICGPYRSGKSYILSRLLRKYASEELVSVFKVGHTFRSCTVGIWMATHVIIMDDHCVLLLDTEGIDAPKSSKSARMSLLAITTLLSSFLIYNSNRVPEKRDLDNLNCLARFSSAFVETTNIHTTFPHFAWLLRNVTLEMVDKQTGERLTPSEFLTHVLNSSKEMSDASDTLRKLFPQLHGYKLPPPSDDPDIVQDMEAKESELLGDFNHEVEKVLGDFLHKAKVKGTPEGGVISGIALGRLTVQLVDSLDGSENLPDLDGLWSKVVESTCGKIVKKLLGQYREQLNAELEHRLPLEEGSESETCMFSASSTLYGVEKHILQVITSQLEADVKMLVPQGEVGRICTQFEEQTQDIFEDFTRKNVAKSRELCKQVLIKLCEPLEACVHQAQSSEEFHYSPDTYSKEWSITRSKYYQNIRAKGPAKETVEQEYVRLTVRPTKKLLTALQDERLKTEKLLATADVACELSSHSVKQVKSKQSELDRQKSSHKREVKETTTIFERHKRVKIEQFEGQQRERNKRDRDYWEGRSKDQSDRYDRQLRMQRESREHEFRERENALSRRLRNLN